MATKVFAVATGLSNIQRFANESVKKIKFPVRVQVLYSEQMQKSFVRLPGKSSSEDLLAERFIYRKEDRKQPKGNGFI